MTNLNPQQKEELIESYVELIVDSMDTKDLVRYVSDNLTEYYEDCSDVELKEFVDNYDEDLYDELVDNVTQQYPKQLNQFEKERQDTSPYDQIPTRY